jgi:exosortase O
MSRAVVNAGVLVGWVALHADALRWLGAAWLRDEGQVHGVMALVVLGWGLARWSPAAGWAAMQRPLRAAWGPLAVAVVGAACARAAGLDTARAAATLLSAWGLWGLFVERSTWRASAAPALLLAATLPMTGPLDVLVGYPLRSGVAEAVAWLLGGAVDAGTVLALDGRRAHVDVPCAGVRGLWTATVLCVGAMVGAGRSLSAMTAAALAAAWALQIGQNALRVTLVVGLTMLDPLLADVAHLPLGVMGFAVALVGPLAWIAASDPPGAVSSAPGPRWPGVAWAVAVLWALLGLVEPTRSAPRPSTAVVTPMAWVSLPASPQEEAFYRQHGARLTKARHPSGAQVAFVVSRSWLAHHVPEQCLEAEGWSLSDDRPLDGNGHLVRAAEVRRSEQRAAAMWWFVGPDVATDDHTARIRAGLAADAPWVLVSVLSPHALPAGARGALVRELDALARAALETP